MAVVMVDTWSTVHWGTTRLYDDDWWTDGKVSCCVCHRVLRRGQKGLRMALMQDLEVKKFTMGVAHETCSTFVERGDEVSRSVKEEVCGGFAALGNR